MRTKHYIIAMAMLLSLFGSVQAAVQGLHFRLEVKLQNRPSLDEFNDFLPTDGNLAMGEKVLAGKYDDYLLAMKAKYAYAKRSSNPVVIVAFYLQESISLSQAFDLMHDQSSLDVEVIDRPDTLETAAMLADLRHDLRYRVEIYTDEEHTLTRLYHQHPELQATTLPLAENHYICGEMLHHRDALTLQNSLDAEGFKRNIVTAYMDGKQIPVLLAKGMERPVRAISKSDEVAQMK